MEGALRHVNTQSVQTRTELFSGNHQMDDLKSRRVVVYSGLSVLVSMYWSQCTHFSVLVSVYWCQCTGLILWAVHSAADTDTDTDTDTDLFLEHTVFNGSIHTATDTDTDVGDRHRRR